MPIDGAVAVADAGAGAGGGFGGDTGTGDGGDGGDTGFTGDESGAGDTGSGDGAGDDGSGAQPEYEIDESTGEPKLDAEGNPVPKAVDTKADFKSLKQFNDAYKALKETNPAVADAWRKDHFGIQEYQKSFPTARAAAETKETLDTVGGLEGVEELGRTAQQYNDEIQQFSQGDPKFLGELQKNDPVGFAKSIAGGLNILGSSDPTAYSSALAPILHSSLEAGGVNSALLLAGNTLSDVFQALGEQGDPQIRFALNKAFDAIKKAYDYSGNIKKLADQNAERPLTDREKQLQQKEQTLNQKEQSQYYQSVQKTVTTTMDGAINKALSTYYKQYPKITKEQRADVHSGVFDYISNQLKSNKKYTNQLRALLNGNDVTKVNSFVALNVNKIVAASAKAIWNRRGFGTLPNQQKQAAAGNTNQQVVLNRRPKREDIDWNTTSEMDYMAGKATLKGSKRKVSWDWSKVQ